jgi:hypothetical protein
MGHHMTDDLVVGWIFGSADRQAIWSAYLSEVTSSGHLSSSADDKWLLCLKSSDELAHQKIAWHWRHGACLVIYHRARLEDAETQALYGRIEDLVREGEWAILHLSGQTISERCYHLYYHSNHAVPDLLESSVAILKWIAEQPQEGTWLHFRLWWLYELESRKLESRGWERV